MFNPIDMLQAQGGPGIDAFARQFGLTPDQTRRAAEALLPAFTLGMQRSATDDPGGFARLFGLAAPGGRPAAQSPDALLGQLFGSPMLTQAVIQQASAASGVGTQVLRQMLPAMAGAVVASIVHVMLNQPEAAQRPAPAPASAFPMNPVWAEMMRPFLPPEGGTPPGPPAPRLDPPRAPSPARPPTPRPDAPAAPDLLGQMFQAGAAMQEQNVKAMQGLFDALWPQRAGGPAPPPGEAPPARRDER